MHRDELLTYGALLLATSAYAAVLERYKPRIEPDWTWAEVVIGTSMCLAVPFELGRRGRLLTWQDYERATWRAVATGGLPIVLWQVWQMRMRYRDALKELLAD